MTSNLRYKEIIEEIQCCNSIKYAAYRTASKLLVIYKVLEFGNVSLHLINGVLHRHLLKTTDNHVMLSLEEIDTILHDIYFAAFREKGKNYDVNLSVELTKLFLCDIFRTQNNYISVFHFKVFLVLLCSSPIQEKYHYWFLQLVDHNFRLPRRKLLELLESHLYITDFLSESSNFSHELIEPTLEFCVSQDTALGINENDFVDWLKKEPQILVWVSTFCRLCMALRVVHNASCSVCGIFPIVGLRYHCLRCIRYDLCQICFFTGRSSRKHKPKHLIREYCTQTSFYENTATFLKDVFKRFCGHSSKLQYLPVNHRTSFQREKDTTRSHNERMKLNKLDNWLTRNGEDEPSASVKQEADRILTDIGIKLCDVSGGDVGSVDNHDEDTAKGHLIKWNEIKDEILYHEKPILLNTYPEDSKARNENEIPESTWPIPSPSGFSTWLEGSKHETSYIEQLQVDLDNILRKLNNMLESNFHIDEDNLS